MSHVVLEVESADILVVVDGTRGAMGASIITNSVVATGVKWSIRPEKYADGDVIFGTTADGSRQRTLWKCRTSDSRGAGLDINNTLRWTDQAGKVRMLQFLGATRPYRFAKFWTGVCEEVLISP
jgi:hypothetical protein